MHSHVCVVPWPRPVRARTSSAPRLRRSAACDAQRLSGNRASHVLRAAVRSSRGATSTPAVLSTSDAAEVPSSSRDGRYRRRWEPEELQHGAALKRYVDAAWPNVDWDGAYQSVFLEYAQTCSMDALEPNRALELAARCVVETGTSSFYTMLAEIDREPVLTQLAARIRADEVRHYKYITTS